MGEWTDKCGKGQLLGYWPEHLDDPSQLSTHGRIPGRMGIFASLVEKLVHMELRDEGISLQTSPEISEEAKCSSCKYFF